MSSERTSEVIDLSEKLGDRKALAAEQAKVRDLLEKMAESLASAAAGLAEKHGFDAFPKDAPVGTVVFVAGDDLAAVGPDVAAVLQAESAVREAIACLGGAPVE